MKKIAIVLCIAVFIAACGTGVGSDTKATSDPYTTTTTPANGNPFYDPNRGEGKFTKVEIGAKLDAAMAANGEKVFGVKCSSCHKTTGEKLVGPGWKGVTSRHTAEWIMNFVTQAQLEICLVRMPNQNLADADARALYEFMRKNDGVK
jgi:mono/diheme cytochrome c family protein/predicted small secreted protein